MDDIDVTSSMGRDLPYMFHVVEAARCSASNGPSRSSESPAAVVPPTGRAVRIAVVLAGAPRAEPLKRLAAGCVARSFGVAARRLSAAPVGSASVPRLTSSRSSLEV